MVNAYRKARKAYIQLTYFLAVVPDRFFDEIHIRRNDFQGKLRKAMSELARTNKPGKTYPLIRYQGDKSRSLTVLAGQGPLQPVSLRLSIELVFGLRRVTIENLK